eukprot:3150804-Pyramimonas_sp.AAC.1
MSPAQSHVTTGVLNREEARDTTRILTGGSYSAIACAADPPGDAEIALQTGQPEHMPPSGTGEGEQTCTICAGELRGVVEVPGLCGH